jgi:hypothetical protein
MNAIDLLVQGKTDGDTADAVGVARETVCRWRNNDADFVAELNRRREDVWGSQSERLRNSVKKAVDVLLENLDDEDPKLRQQAAVHILKCVGLYGGKLEPKGPTEAEKVEAKWRRDAAFDDLDAFGI